MSVVVEFTAGLRERISELSALSEDGLETGGILLGHGPEPKRRIEVLEAGDPGPHADRRSGFFLRDLDHAQALADRAWQRSRSIWIGEWHTHLNGQPVPSPADLSTYARLLRGAELEFELFLSVIVVSSSPKDWREPKLYPWVMAISESQLGIPQSMGKEIDE